MGEVVLLSFGNPLLDISAHVEEPFLEKYDLKTGTALLAEPKHLPIYDDLVKNYKVDYVPGGAALNTTRVASWLIRTPNKCAFIGCVGKDENGQILRKETERFGVVVPFLEDENTPTGTCGVLIRDKERTLCTNLGAANKYNIAHLQTPKIQEIVHKANIFYGTGYFLTVSPDSALEIGKHAAQTGKTFLFNLAAPFIIQFFFEQLSALLPYVDVLFSNESEAATFGEKMGWGTDIREIARKLGELPKVNHNTSRTIIFTQGPKSTVVFRRGVITEYKPIPVSPSDIVDLNGAGDSFVGGFLAGLILGKKEDECIHAGHYCASEVIRRNGCTLPEKPAFEWK